MRRVALALVLAGLWMLLTGDPSPANGLAGFVVGLGLLVWMLPASGRYEREVRIPIPATLRKVPGASVFLLFLVQELLLSSLRIAHDVITPGPQRHPALLVVPLDLDSPTQITVLAHLVSLTPGTLAVEVSADRRCMLVHAMFAPDPDALRREIKVGYERRVKELFS